MTFEELYRTMLKQAVEKGSVRQMIWRPVPGIWTACSTLRTTPWSGRSTPAPVPKGSTLRRRLPV